MRSSKDDPTRARLFIALWPSPAVQRALAVAQRSWTWPAGAKPTPRDKLHLTLHFIGSVPAAQVAAIADGIAAPCPPFALTLDHAAVWPNGCAVLETGEPSAPLSVLHGRLAEALQRLRLPVESRPLRPHVTLARRATGAAPPAFFEPVRWPVRSCLLMQSAAGGYVPIAVVAPRAASQSEGRRRSL
jgi:2'-5' RNA ligase